VILLLKLTLPARKRRVSQNRAGRDLKGRPLRKFERLNLIRQNLMTRVETRRGIIWSLTARYSGTR
jgi:hypothetical protein